MSGDVQGVFFRDSCAQAAYVHGVAGWVRNRRDGAVEACFEGEPAAVDAMVSWCRSGPPGADVRDVAVTEEEPVGESGFRVTG